MKLFWILLIGLFSLSLQAEPLPLPPQAHLVLEGLGELEKIPDIVELDVDVRETAENFGRI